MLSGCIGYGRAKVDRPQGGGAEVWTGIPEARGLDGSEQRGLAVRDGEGRAMRLLHDEAGQPWLIRPEGWPGGWQVLRPSVAAADVRGGPVSGWIRLDEMLYFFPRFPASPAGVAFSESAGEILAEYAVRSGPVAASRGPIDLYAELHLPAGFDLLEPAAGILDLRLILPIDLRLPDPLAFPGLHFEYYLIRERDGEDSGVIYQRVVGEVHELHRWSRALGGLTARLTIAGTLLEIDPDGSWRLTPPLPGGGAGGG